MAKAQDQFVESMFPPQDVTPIEMVAAEIPQQPEVPQIAEPVTE